MKLQALERGVDLLLIDSGLLDSLFRLSSSLTTLGMRCPQQAICMTVQDFPMDSLLEASMVTK
jgi:hypothetical protein